MYLGGVGIFLLGVFAMLYMKGVSPSALISPAAIALHLLAILGVLTATHGFKLFWRGLRALIWPKKWPLTEGLRGQAALLFRLLSKTAALTSLIGILISIISALGYMNDIEHLGHAVSAAFITPLLGLMLMAAVFEPAAFILKKRQSSELKAKTKTKATKAYQSQNHSLSLSQQSPGR